VAVELEFTDTAVVSNVLRYVHDCGLKISRAGLDLHIKHGLLRRDKNGQFSAKAVKRYAHERLDLITTGMTAAEGEDNLMRDKLIEDIKLKRVQRQREELRLEAEQGRFLPRAEVELELAGRAAVLAAGYEHMVYSRAAEFMAATSVEQLIAAMLVAKDEWLHQYASSQGFEVVFTEEGNP
jgi:hypothetical protein